jgi:hypothetical protein
MTGTGLRAPGSEGTNFGLHRGSEMTGINFGTNFGHQLLGLLQPATS